MKYFHKLFSIIFSILSNDLLLETTPTDNKLYNNTTDFHFSMMDVTYTPGILKHGYNIP